MVKKYLSSGWIIIKKFGSSSTESNSLEAIKINTEICKLHIIQIILKKYIFSIETQAFQK